jgi:meiotic recombination protein SPO11
VWRARTTHPCLGPLPPSTPPQLNEEFIQANPDWVAELELMLKTKEKAEIQALSSFGFQYLSQVYLPLKLQEGDWI